MSLDILEKNMQSSENKIDRFFSGQLAEHEVVPPASVWKNIEKSLDEKKRKRRVIWLIGFSSAASLLLAFIAGWYVSSVDHGKNDTRTAVVAPVYSAPAVSPDHVMKHDFVEQQSSSKKEETFIVSSEPEKSKESVSSEQGNDIMRENVLITFLLPEIPVLESSAGISSSLSLLVSNDESFSEADRAIIERNLQEKKESRPARKSSAWAVGVEASPVYCFDPSSFRNDLDAVASPNPASAENALYGATTSPNPTSANVSTVYATSFSGGVSVSYHSGDRLTFQSGLNYGSISQNAGDVGVSFVGHNWVSYSSVEDDVKNYEMVVGSRNNTANNVTLNTSMGEANIALPVGAELASRSVTDDNKSEITRNYDLAQQADYLEIPLIVRYKIINKRLDFHLLGGWHSVAVLEWALGMKYRSAFHYHLSQPLRFS